MKKIFILKDNNEFNRIISNFKPFRTKNFNIYVEKDKSDKFYFGFSVGKKIGNAVARNKIKRRMKNILNNKRFNSKFKCIIMAKKTIIDEKYEDLENELLSALSKMGLL